ncbi:MAG: GntR family transcriptional regulator [Acidobacteria bacterium]|nr:GntR family transcriptional regulator [Acidobacteriota bacterium]
MRRLRRTPTENLATTQLRNAILSGSLPPGARLRQVDLATRFGVSRMPVRQALLALEQEGLVKIDAWRGSIVAPLDADTIRDMYAVRAILERLVAKTLAERKTLDITALRKVIVAGRRATAQGDYSRLIDLDVKFHTQLYEAFGNRALLEIMHGVWTHIRRIMAMMLRLVEYRSRLWDEHDAILSAIEAGDPDRAGALAEGHINNVAAIVIRHLGSLVEQNASETSVPSRGLKRPVAQM